MRITGGKGGASCSDFSSSHSSVSFFVVFEKTREVCFFFSLLLCPSMSKQGKSCGCVFIVTGSRMAPLQGIPAQTIPKGTTLPVTCEVGGFPTLGRSLSKKTHQKPINRKKKQTKHPAFFLSLGENILTIPDERAQPDGAHCTCFSCFSWLWLLG